MLLNKMELKRQKDKLGLYSKSLPSLKKKQSLLQKQIIIMENEIKKLENEIENIKTEISKWIAVFGEKIDFPKINIENILLSDINIAGIDILKVENVLFKVDYSLKDTPWWIDDAISILKEIIELSIKIKKEKENILKLNNELEITNQRINLFEKKLIPECENNIRKIKIFLADQQVAAVCRGKIMKRKNELKEVLS